MKKLRWPHRFSCLVAAAALALIGAVRPAAAANLPTEVKSMMEKIKWLGHAGFRIDGEKTIYIDPFKIKGGGKADIVLITHDHYDHCSPADVNAIWAKDTEVLATAACADKLGRQVTVVAPGSTLTVKGIKIETVPAYNIGKRFHPREAGNVGYIVEVGGVRIYHAGDTDLIPEMKNVKADIALLPVGGTYTMNSSEATEAAKMIKPKLAVPMHWGDVVGSARDADVFKMGSPVPVEIMQPER